MFGLQIHTSKSDRLWPTGYWKSLIDALVRGGSKHDPRQTYRDLASPLQQLIEQRNGRFFSKAGSLLATSDDSAIQLLLVQRVAPGNESVVLGTPQFARTADWTQVPCDFFGTIGNSKYETQSKRNREMILFQCQAVIDACLHSRCLGLCFRLGSHRRERDLDNLMDAVVPAFNARVPMLDHICLVKEQSPFSDREILGLTCDCDNILQAAIIHK